MCGRVLTTLLLALVLLPHASGTASPDGAATVLLDDEITTVNESPPIGDLSPSDPDPDEDESSSDHDDSSGQDSSPGEDASSANGSPDRDDSSDDVPTGASLSTDPIAATPLRSTGAIVIRTPLDGMVSGLFGGGLISRPSTEGLEEKLVDVPEGPTGGIIGGTGVPKAVTDLERMFHTPTKSNSAIDMNGPDIVDELFIPENRVYSSIEEDEVTPDSIDEPIEQSFEGTLYREAIPAREQVATQPERPDETTHDKAQPLPNDPPATSDSRTVTVPVRVPIVIAVAVAAAAAASLWVLWYRASAIAAALFTRISRAAATRQPVRRRILDLMAGRPGWNPTELMQETGLAEGTIRYHLRVLQRHGLVAVEKSAGKLYYFVTESNGMSLPAQALALLQSQQNRLIAKAIYCQPGINQGAIAERLGRSQSQIHARLGRLEKAQLVSRTRQGRCIVYEATPLLAKALNHLENPSQAVPLPHAPAEASRIAG